MNECNTRMYVNTKNIHSIVVYEDHVVYIYIDEYIKARLISKDMDIPINFINNSRHDTTTGNLMRINDVIAMIDIKNELNTTMHTSENIDIKEDATQDITNSDDDFDSLLNIIKDFFNTKE